MCVPHYRHNVVNTSFSSIQQTKFLSIIPFINANFKIYSVKKSNICSNDLWQNFHLHRFYEIICMMTKSLLLLPLKYGREAYFVIRITHADALFCPSLFLWNLIFVPHYADNVVSFCLSNNRGLITISMRARTASSVVFT